MIWDDPWCVAASSDGGTSLPPMKVVLENHQRFEVSFSFYTVARFYEHNRLVSSCILHLYDVETNLWILETFSAIEKRRGYGTMLLRCVVDWIFNYTGRRFILGYTWELSVLGFVGAWWKGWLKTTNSIEFGWMIEKTEEEATAIATATATAICTESGLNDGWGTVISQSGVNDWNAQMKSRGWKYLWMRSLTQPQGQGHEQKSKWRWTGEIVVVGLLNKPRGLVIDTHWITPDKSPKP